MAHPPSVSARTASACDALRLLDGEFAALAKGVAEGRYGLWLGSGISSGQVDGLSEIVPRVLEFLRTEAVKPDPQDHDKALSRALALAELDETQIEGIDFAVPFSEWSDHDAIVKQLVNQYSLLLDIRVGRREPDYLLWTAVDIAVTFPESVEPDCEHLCIAALILEGVLPQIASANWDGMIESAMERLAPSSALLDVCVLPEDLRELSGRSQLLKFHGCAIKAVKDETTYRSRLIARYSQITNWPNAPEHAAMRHKLTDLLVARPALVIGLSTRDINIQDRFSAARVVMPLVWPSTAPAHVFSGDSLSPMQRNILQVAYGDGVYAENSSEIDRESCIPAFGKPLLCGLLLHVLAQKTMILARTLLAPTFNPSELDIIDSGVRAVRDAVATSGGHDRWAKFIDDLLAGHSRAMSILRTGSSAPSGSRRYFPIGLLPTGQIPEDPSLATNGYPETAAALVLVGLGHSRSAWTMDQAIGTEVDHGTLRLSTTARTYRLFLVANEGAAIELFRQGALTESDDDAVIVYGTTPAPPRTRSPVGAYGRTGAAGPRSIHMREVVGLASTADDLFQEFELAGGLV